MARSPLVHEFSFSTLGQSSGSGTTEEEDLNSDYIRYEDLTIDFTQELGNGAFGNVYKGLYYGTEIAVKQTKIPDSDDDLRRFLKREVLILKSLRHPHIVQFVGVSKHEGNLQICTEYAKGGDLHNCLKSTNNLYGMWRTKLVIAQQVSSAMAYLHSRQIVFRDMKGKNVLLDDKKNPKSAKLCDFGFARVLQKGSDPNANPLKNSNYLTICGTDDWMAPEVILGMDYDNKSDVFSYGVLLLEMILGTKMIKKELKREPRNAFELDLNKVRTLAPRTCPQKFVELALFCCAYQPKDRPDFKSIVIVLNKVLSEDGIVDLQPEDILLHYSQEVANASTMSSALADLDEISDSSGIGSSFADLDAGSIIVHSSTFEYSPRKKVDASKNSSVPGSIASAIERPIPTEPVAPSQSVKKQEPVRVDPAPAGSTAVEDDGRPKGFLEGLADQFYNIFFK